jgi:hypothetical protein
LGATNGFTLFNNDLAFSASYDTLNGQQLWLYSDIPAAIAEVEKTPSFTLYPNPCQDFYMLSGFKAGDTYNISLMDITGRILQVQQMQASGTVQQFYSPAISAGIYLVEVRNGQEISTLRMVKSDR